MANPPTLEQIRQAADRIGPYVHRTPVLTCRTINAMVGAEIFFKCENFQKAGAFKFRGATNAVFSLTEKEASRGVATHSSGNHAAALSLAARTRGAKAYVVMPRTAPQVKKDAVAGYGAEITFCEPTLAAREQTLEKLVEVTGASAIHPYNDYRIIAGQATAALELLEDVVDLDIVMTPIGGGGLASGTALYVKLTSPETKVIAAEPMGADDAYRSFRAGKLIPSENLKTIADGLLTSLGDKTFPIVTEYLDDIVTVSEEGIIQAMRCIWERMKVVVEPSAAVPLGALLTGRLEAAGKRVGIILSGGNVDLNKLPWISKTDN
ncbi:MAG: pyridoxal-phosphate dependent enzyme [Phycisphaerales bacterium]|nr:MAG: pyridoxal-phosphate dependent enzyme [Phycisphaerales bacterium]